MLLPLTLLLGNCASTQNVVQYYANGLAKLDGVWVDTGFSRNRNDIVFDVTLERVGVEMQRRPVEHEPPGPPRRR